MSVHIDHQTVLDKTLELCDTIVSQPDFSAIRQNVEQFLADDQARQLYQTVVEKSETLHQKQHQGVTLTPEEISDFEGQRQTLLQNERARNFLDAQEQMRQIQDTVTRYVAKTIELGRVPSEDDFASCGAGCSCQH